MSKYILSEDLAVWFGKKKKKKGSSQPKGPWVNICKKKKGGGHPPCGRKMPIRVRTLCVEVLVLRVRCLNQKRLGLS